MNGPDIDSSVAETVALLWSDHSRPVGRTGLTISDFIAAAIELVRADGMEGLSMRAIAQRLGVRTMATYSFAPGKSALLALMADRAYHDLYADIAPSRASGWRMALTAVAEANRRLYLSNPWLLAARPARSPMGPHEIEKNEIELGTIADIGLSDFEMDQVLASVLNHAAYAGGQEAQLLTERRSSGLNDTQWWGAVMPQLERVVDPKRFPLTARIGRSATEARNGEFWGDRAFHFGLDRLLDGIEMLVRSR